MALITCPECGKEISDTAVSCPNCGYIMKENKTAENVNNIQQNYTTIEGRNTGGEERKLFDTTLLTLAGICLLVFVICWYYKASHGVAIAEAEVDYAAVRYVSTTMIMGRMCSILEPVSIIACIVLFVLSLLKGEKKNG